MISDYGKTTYLAHYTSQSRSIMRFVPIKNSE